MIIFPAIDLKNGQCARHIAFGQPHALAVLQVDGRKDDHAVSQRLRNASP